MSDMNIKLIKSKKDYRNSLLRLEVIFDVKSGTKEGNELEVLSILTEKYENDHFPIDLPEANGYFSEIEILKLQFLAKFEYEQH
jgi:antitoxin component HigA of HigAB toxin-antitoxin module